MKAGLSFRWLGQWMAGERKKARLRLLREQRMLLRNGHETTAEVIGSSLQNDKIGNLLLVHVWLKLRKMDGSFFYTHAKTLVSTGHIPGKGSVLRVKYSPDHPGSIVIL